jgi:hypothetical protein
MATMMARARWMPRLSCANEQTLTKRQNAKSFVTMPNDFGDCSLAPHDQPREHRLWDLALIQRPLLARFFLPSPDKSLSYCKTLTLDTPIGPSLEVTHCRNAAQPSSRRWVGISKAVTSKTFYAGSSKAWRLPGQCDVRKGGDNNGH